ncbi:WD repeat-containing protein 61 isoform X2 [Aethina tumida]|uniref:WD repeat-containing protein 61 isoform X2 n=1 Tax=Aethina tumida TaxID=116153 RepID=UPI002148F4B1|nr:WD repeat-containing protein 61 isoform X2 [Aethina tumida]
MYVVDRKKQAHDGGVWCCDWKACPPETINKNAIFKTEIFTIPDEPLQEYIVTCGGDKFVKVWELHGDELELKHNLEGHQSGVVSVAISNSGKLCVSRGLDCTLRIWDIEKGSQIAEAVVMPTDSWSVLFTQDDQHVISCSKAGIVTLYNAKTGKPERKFGKNTKGSYPYSMACSPDGKIVVTGSADGIINAYDIHNGKHCGRVESHAKAIRSMCFTYDSQNLLTSSEDQQMRVYDVQTTGIDMVTTICGHDSYILSVSLSPNGKYFVSGSADMTIKVWDFELRTCLETFIEHTHPETYNNDPRVRPVRAETFT